MKNLILIGGGGHCRACIDVIEREHKYKIKGILDNPDKVGQAVLNYKIIGTDDDIEKYIKKGFKFLITIGQIHSADIRLKLFEKIKSFGGELAVIVSPYAYVSKYSKINEGTIVMHGAIINAGAVVGKNCIINTKALIEHDCEVGDNCHIAVGAVLSGGVNIGSQSFVGANSTVVQGLTIPVNSFIKACCLVTPQQKF